ncbi:hypothetical protein BGZ95_009808 [Linnemannia exigua]|uniref:HCP-like protein n=1 Tax=Linnemannia exigua TaxID=604196 RepID=A0AAD4H6T7_9FUNG|nr:hypothetical protein BGZ95_009808 [Linnemannia exigua]
MQPDGFTHLQAVRPISKSNLDSPTAVTTPPPQAVSTPAVYIDCHLDPITQKNVVMWEDIRLAFADALHIRHQARVVPFLRGTDLMLLKPLRIAAMPDVTLDIVVEEPLARIKTAVPQISPQATVQDSTKEISVQEEAKVQRRVSANSTTVVTITGINTATVGRNPAYGLIEAAMQNYNHIDNPAFGRQPRAPQYIPSFDNDHFNEDESPSSMASTYAQLASNKSPTNTKFPLIDNRLPQPPQGYTTAAGVKDIAPIVMKATLGDANSQVELGNMYKLGDGVEQDYEAARYWYLKAAKQGKASGQCGVGDLYRLGLGIDFNHSTALSWYQKAVGQGDASGQCNLGLMYQYGLAVEMDYVVAMDWYLKSADQGYAPAQSRIGDLYFHGRGVPQDYSKAMERYLLGVTQDSSEAYFNMGSLYLNGYGVAMDKDVALEWFRKATSHGGTDCLTQFFMGVLYLEGIGTPRDYSKAHECFLKSSRQGLAEAQRLIACLYLLGYGVPQDHAEAMKWLRKGADHHHPEAQYAIGEVYHHGLGVPKNYSVAREWYVKAARQEQPYAKEALVKLQQLVDKEGK